MENITSKGTIFGTLIAQAGPKGDTGKTGDRGLTGETGYSPVKGIDYFTLVEMAGLLTDRMFSYIQVMVKIQSFRKGIVLKLKITQEK